MQMQIHDVNKITAKLTIFDNFHMLTLTVVNDSGVETEIKLFSDEIENLSIINKPVRIAYDK